MGTSRRQGLPLLLRLLASAGCGDSAEESPETSGTDPNSSGGQISTTEEEATSEEPTGGVAEAPCPQRDDYDCPTTVASCKGQRCGELEGPLDADGCLRQECQDDADCSEGGHCYNQWASSGFYCEESDDECVCYTHDDIQPIGYCVTEDLWPGGIHLARLSELQACELPEPCDLTHALGVGPRDEVIALGDFAGYTDGDLCLLQALSYGETGHFAFSLDHSEDEWANDYTQWHVFVDRDDQVERLTLRRLNGIEEPDTDAPELGRLAPSSYFEDCLAETDLTAQLACLDPQMWFLEAGSEQEALSCAE